MADRPKGRGKRRRGVMLYGQNHTSQGKQSGAVEACWAHNPEVDGSKPFSAKTFFFC